jgi:hypothetical protein
LYRSSDGGTSWILSGSVVDPVSYQRFVAPEVIAVAVRRDTVWIGGPDGLAFTADDASTTFGSRWRIIRSALPVAPATEMYVYPNPFSPAADVARVHYAVNAGGAEVTIRIFDVALQPVRDLLIRASRPSGQHDEVWDGRTNSGNMAANGVYLVRVAVGNTEPVWGKAVVLQ